jgi:hypothetical protein
MFSTLFPFISLRPRTSRYARANAARVLEKFENSWSEACDWLMKQCWSWTLLAYLPSNTSFWCSSTFKPKLTVVLKPIPNAGFPVFCEIWGSRRGKCVVVGFLDCDAVWTCRYTAPFRRDILPPSSVCVTASLNKPNINIRVKRCIS